MSANPNDGTWNGVYRQYEIYVTGDSGGNPAGWGAPVASGQWTWTPPQEQKTLNFMPQVGKYVYFRRVTAYGWAQPLGYASANEIWVHELTGGNGPPVTFTVAAIGNPSLTYQWRKNGVNIAGATAYEYTLATTHGEDAGVYDVVVSNTYGSTTSAAAILTVVAGPNRVYTSAADFAGNGILINLNTNTPGELRLNDTPRPLPYLNVPSGDYSQQGRNTLMRLDALGGMTIGEFRTAPENLPAPSSPAVSPSRTAVDRFGNVWVANRYDTLPIGSVDKGSVCRIGIVIGGIRGARSGSAPNYVFTPDPNGEYLKPPFAYSTCPDRDGDGLIRSSHGLANILPWLGNDSSGGVAGAQDEGILDYVRVSATGVRTIAVDASNDVWVGGTDNRVHEKLDGVSGAALSGTRFPPSGDGTYGGYGGVVDGYGILWSSAGGESEADLLRLTPSPLSGEPFCRYGGGYGLGINPRNQEIWYAQRDSGEVSRYLNGSSQRSGATYHGSAEAQGVVVDYANDIWVAHVLDNGFTSAGPGLGTTVGHIHTDGFGNGQWVGNVQLAVRQRSNTDQPVPPGPTGLSVDHNGKVWVCNYSHGNVMRIDPSGGPIGDGGVPIGAVDLSVDLGDGSGHVPPYDIQARPYPFSDMTGFGYLGATSPSGVWCFVFDSGVAGKSWSQGAVTWIPAAPAGTWVKVEARAADTVAGLPGRLAARNHFKTVNSQFGTVTGRYLEVRSTLGRNWGVTANPVLSELTIHP